MKGYALLFLLTALLLLLLPVAALPRQQATITPPAEESSIPPADDPGTDTEKPDTDGDDASTDAATGGEFKLLCEDKVVTLTAREFLIRTLAAEMSPSYHSEALKAQAVAAYTYYGRRRAAQETKPDQALKGAHFVTANTNFPGEYTNDKLKERWGSRYDLYYTKLCEAVDSVLGRAMTYDGEYIDACYFSNSNGCTESAQTVWGADIPYLQAVASPGDRLAPDYRSTLTLTAEEVRTALSADTTVSLPEDPAGWFGEPVLSEAGTVVSIPVGGTALAGTKVRQLLGLRSSTFVVTYADGSFTFTVSGYGHGVGMSQYGADYLARQGYSWEEILQYYYTAITIV